MGFYIKLKDKRINISLLLIVIFLILGFYLRVYHLNFPYIGYHNMKEHEYLDPAYHFLEEGNFLHKKAFAFYGLDEGLGYHEEYGQVPAVSYLVFIIWKIFGITLWMPRLAMIFFMLGSIILTYLVAKQLTNNEYISLLSSFLMSFMPLGIYFGRNIQPDPPALFLILLATFFYLKWTDSLKIKYIFISMLFIAIAMCFKTTFAIILIPFLFIFPYKKMLNLFKNSRKNFFGNIVFSFMGILPGVLLNLLFEVTIVDESKKNYVIEPFRIFGADYWITRLPTIKAYISDNFTWWFFYFALLGLLLALTKYKTKFSRFAMGTIVSLIPYIALVSSKFAGHSYYQMPFMPIVCMLSAYFIYMCGSMLRQITRIKLLQFVPLLLLILTISSVTTANNRVWDTLFYGQEIVGEYINKQTKRGDRMFALSHSQSLAVCSYAKRGCGWVNTLKEFKHKENVFNIEFLYIDAGKFNILKNNKELFKYVSNNYRIDFVGMIQTGNNLAPLHFLLRKGGIFNMSDIQNKKPI
ncbi:glycosyltransferase family 39 protein, partial [Candidatus Woesearchaeota archaeon]|nr:glycosyltransferase family 39 protein [Candidatus Woesearchaeota archaeon]